MQETNKEEVKYNSVSYTLIENFTAHFYLNLNHPMTEKEIKSQLNKIGFGYYAVDLDKLLDGNFVDEEDVRKNSGLKAPCYHFVDTDECEEE